jgi:hypothetical protein
VTWVDSSKIKRNIMKYSDKVQYLQRSQLTCSSMILTCYDSQCQLSIWKCWWKYISDEMDVSTLHSDVYTGFYIELHDLRLSFASLLGTYLVCDDKDLQDNRI